MVNGTALTYGKHFNQGLQWLRDNLSFNFPLKTPSKHLPTHNTDATGNRNASEIGIRSQLKTQRKLGTHALEAIETTYHMLMWSKTIEVNLNVKRRSSSLLTWSLIYMKTIL